ncbi:MAG: carboxypeptidase-like regulatory domain-containing protein, partial [Verrucomicrobiota bacterium]
MKKCLTAGLLLTLSAGALLAKPEAFQTNRANRNQLPPGKEADGIEGDFILRNDKVVAVVSSHAHLRKANMGVFWGGIDNITPGCLYDLTFRDDPDDQLIYFSPSNQRGPVSYVRVVDDGKPDAKVETVVEAARNSGIYERHLYRLADRSQSLKISTTVRNEDKGSKTYRTTDKSGSYTRSGHFQGVFWFDAIDPAHKTGYATMWLKNPGENVSLEPGDEFTFHRYVAVGRSPAEAVGEAWSSRGGSGSITGRLVDDQGQPVGSARIEIKQGDRMVPAYPDDDCRFAFRFPPGKYDVRVVDIGRADVSTDLDVKSRKVSVLNLTLGPVASITLDIKDEAGKSIPCKAQFLAIDGTKKVNLGPPNRAHGCLDQYHSETGSFKVQIPPGSYRVVVTRGIEFSYLAEKVKVGEGE